MTTSPTCPTCQASLREGAHFCPSCGTALAAAAPPPVQPTGKRPSGKGTTTQTTPAPTDPTEATPGRPRRTPILVAGIAAILIVLVIAIAVVATGSSEGDRAQDSATQTTASGGPAALPPATTTPPSGAATEEDPATNEPAVPSATAGPLQAVSAVATNTRAGVNLRCPPHNFISYDPSLLIDGNENTGWGASSGDGTGQSITIRFAGPRHLTSVGITPGYTKFGPRYDQNCAAVSAFPFNRFVTSVEYRFDDGSVETQQFQQTASLQTMAVDETTTSVQITILGTTRPINADDDTIISEAAFEGTVA